MQQPFINNPVKMKEEYSKGKMYWDNLAFKDAAVHYAKSIRFSGGKGVNPDNFRTYYDLALVLCAYGDYKGAIYCYSVAAYLDKEMQGYFKEQYTKFEDIANLPKGIFKTLIVSYSWQFGHAILDNSTDIQKFPDWEKYVLGYRNFIREYRDMMPFDYPKYMGTFYPREVVDFYMKVGIEFAENAMKLNDNNIETMISYVLYTSIPTILTFKEQYNHPKLQKENNNSKAQYDLAKKYFGGVGLEDIGKAVELFHKAEMQGLDEAQVQLGNMNFNEEISEKNNKEAFKYHANAYGQGNKDKTAGSKNIDKIGSVKINTEKSVIEREKDIIREGVKAKRAGNYEKSIEYYKQAVSLVPQNGDTYYALAKVLYIAGHYEESFRSYLLAYLHNATCIKKDLHVHAGHAILDIENSKNPKYARLIKEYTASLQGKIPLLTGKAHQDYMNICEAKGEEEILHQAKILSQQ